MKLPELINKSINIPSRNSKFVGRNLDIYRIVQNIEDNRLVIITG
jgi:hypothetical protein